MTKPISCSKKVRPFSAANMVKIKMEGTSHFSPTTTTGIAATDIGGDCQDKNVKKEEVVIKIEGADYRSTRKTKESIIKPKEQGICHCGAKCSWEKDLPKFKARIKNMVEICKDTNRSTPTPSEMRFQGYRCYAKIHHPGLQRGERIRIPSCVVDNIRSEWPNADGVAYVGHKDFDFHYR